VNGAVTVPVPREIDTVKVELIKQLVFEAAHSNPRGGPAQQRLHGHSYEVDILASGTPDPNVGWIVDFAMLKDIFAPLYGALDHAHLNRVEGLEEDATAPALVRWLDARISPKPGWLDGVRVRILGDLAFRPVHLPADGHARLPARVRFTFEAAQSLPALPGDHPCKKVHGHSYRIEVGAEDLAALEPHLAELYDYFDHRYLNELPGLGQATVEVLSGHIWGWLTERGVAPTAVVVQETPSSRCIYRGE
jgi:6-pyruvoyltetrahydropterin/6-carboxytetrahydropterin synthase